MAEVLRMSRVFRDGTNISASATVPLDVAGQTITVSADIGATDLVDPTLSFRMSLWVFDTQAQVWRFSIGASWVGDATNVDTPSFAFSGSDIAGRQVRCELSVPVRMRLGLVATLAVPPIN